MSTTPDLEQALREAIVSALDAAPAIVAITQRASGNVVAWESLAEDTALPVVAYRVSALREGPMVGDAVATVELRGIADSERTAIELGGVASDALTNPALAAATPALDAAVLSRTRGGLEHDEFDAAHAPRTVELLYSLM